MTDVATAPPHDLDAEEQLLGAIMLSRPAFIAATDAGITAADFYRPAHATIWAAAATVATQGALPDPVTIASHVNGQLGDNPQRELLRIQAATSYTGNATAYARRIRDCARRRAIMAIAADLTHAASNGTDTSVLLARANELATIDQDASRLVDGGAFILDSPDRPPAIWGSDDRILWSAGESLLICGPAGVGKTTLVMQLLAGRLGVLDSLLDLPVAATGRGLYLACDRPSQIQRAFTRLFRSEHRGLLDERLAIWKGPPPSDFGRSPQALLSMCRRANADFVIIDSLKDVAIGLSDDDVAAGLNSGIQLALAEGVDVVVLHHQRKGQAGAKPRTLEDVYGSTWITAGAGSVVLLWGDPGDPIVDLKHLKQPAAEVGPFEISHDQDAGTMSILGGDVDPLLVLRAARDGMTPNDLAVRKFGTAKPERKLVERARRELERLARKGLATRVEIAGTRVNEQSVRYYAVAREPELDLAAAEREDELDRELRF